MIGTNLPGLPSDTSSVPGLLRGPVGAVACSSIIDVAWCWCGRSVGYPPHRRTVDVTDFLPKHDGTMVLYHQGV